MSNLIGDPFEYDPTKSGLMADIMRRGLGFNVDPSSDSEAPYGPADVNQTSQVRLADTVGGTALIDGDTEL
jgi:hypothetical protein